MTGIDADIRRKKEYIAAFNLENDSRSSGTQPRCLDRGQTPQGTSNTLFLPADKNLTQAFFTAELFPTVADTLGAYERAQPHERTLKSAALISMSDDFEIVHGRKLPDAFREEVPEATPIFRQTNALLAERRFSRAPRTSQLRAKEVTRTRLRGSPSGFIGTVLFSTSSFPRKEDAPDA